MEEYGARTIGFEEALQIQFKHEENEKQLIAFIDQFTEAMKAFSEVDGGSGLREWIELTTTGKYKDDIERMRARIK